MTHPPHADHLPGTGDIEPYVFDLDANGYQFDNDPSTKVQDVLQLGCYDPLVWHGSPPDQPVLIPS